MDEITENVLRQAELALDTAGKPIVTIRTPQEASRLFRVASEAGLKIRISGSGYQSQLSGDRLIVKTTALNSVTGVSERDMLMTAGAGMLLKDTAQYTERYGYNLAEYGGTIGGCFAGRHSVIRDKLNARILAMTYVTPTGEILRLGSHSVKDVAGYRLLSLLYGSEGRLGLIAEVSINLANIFREYSSVRIQKKSASNTSESVLAELKQNIVSEIDPKGILQ